MAFWSKVKKFWCGHCGEKEVVLNEVKHSVQIHECKNCGSATQIYGRTE